MIKFAGIVESPTPPPIQYIWLYKGEARYFSNGKWTSISKDKVGFTEESATGVSVVAPVIKLGNTTEDKENNVRVCSELATTDVVSMDVEGTFHGLSYDALGIYHNGTVSILEGNKCTVFDIDFNTGEVTLDSKYDTSKLLPYVDLEIGNSEEVKAYNLERLQLGHFFVAVDYGYGVGSWNPTTGGHAHIVTAFGNTVYYNLSPNGVVVKEVESPDLYYEYTNAGGTKTPTQFVQELIDLIG